MNRAASSLTAHHGEVLQPFGGPGRVGQDGRVETVRISAGELLVRPWAPADADAVFRAFQDPLLHRWLSGLPWPYRISDAAAFVGELAPRLLADGRSLQLGVFAGDGLVGSVALNAIDRAAGTAEIGYWSAPWARGRRITERAGRAVLQWAFAEGRNPQQGETEGLGLRRVDWRATVGNHPSRLTALRLGFTMIGEQPGAAPTGRRADGEQPAGPAVPDRWLASLLPGDLTAEGTEVSDPVRRAARTFSAPHPILRAGALTLRPPTHDDIPGIVECRTDPGTARWFGVPQPYTEHDARTHVERDVPRRWARGVEAVFAIADASDAYAGSVDLRIDPDDPAVGEVGFAVSPRSRGRGYAGAAVRAICRWGFAELGLRRIEWRAEVGNDASRRVAEKAGFTMEGLLRQGMRGRERQRGDDGSSDDGRGGDAGRDCWVGSLVRGDLP
jgi:RimJ/RimL family protein N-acetyltransferase